MNYNYHTDIIFVLKNERKLMEVKLKRKQNINGTTEWKNFIFHIRAYGMNLSPQSIMIFFECRFANLLSKIPKLMMVSKTKRKSEHCQNVILA